MKKLLKELVKSAAFQNSIAWVLSCYLKLVFHTSKWDWVGVEQANSHAKKGNLIVAFWHGRMAMTPFLKRWFPRRVVALMSGHGDGMMVARTFSYLDIGYTSGSTNRGGAKGFLKLLEILKSGDIVAIIPDGPRGPAQKLAVGVIQLSRHSQAAIMPVAYATSRFITFNSWDKFKFPLPFSKGVYICGDPILPLDTSDPVEIESWRLIVENQLTELQDQADRHLKNKE